MTLDDWLRHIETLHPRTIDLGLERIGEVARRLDIDFSDRKVVTVAGTNGKGSTLQFMAGMLGAAGFSTGLYTSPHLLKYNERICLNGTFAGDRALCDAFAAVERARDDIPLTYFEFGTLAAFVLFSGESLDYLILEVGLGGRLDAVNIVDPDLAVLTNVALDHMEWLGADRDAIGREKAAVFRAGRPALYGEPDVPDSVVTHAADTGARLLVRGRDFDWTGNEDGASWRWWGKRVDGTGIVHDKLPVRGMPLAPFLDNAALAVQAMQFLEPDTDADTLARGLLGTVIPGRFQIIDRGHAVVLDVAHNPHAAANLAANIEARFPGRRVRVVLAMLANKDIGGVLNVLSPVAGKWYAANLQEERGARAKILYNELTALGQSDIVCCDSPQQAFTRAENEANDDDVILVTGSFYTVSAVMELL